MIIMLVEVYNNESSFLAVVDDNDHLESIEEYIDEK
jgi:hypothetical protein